MSDTNEKNDELEGTDKGVTLSKNAEALIEKLAESLATAVTSKSGGNTEEIKHVISADLAGKGIKDVGYPSDLTNLTKDEKIVLFFKSMVMRASDPYTPDHDRVFKALVEGTDALGGYLVPEELRSEVFRVLPDFAVMRNIARVIPMSSDTLKLNSLTARPSAYWTAEYGSKTTSSAEFGQVSLTPNDLVCLLPVTHQLLADANINVVNFIVELFAEAIGQAEDKAFFTGSGTGQPRGISQETLTQRDAGGTVDFDDLISLVHSLPQRVRRSPRAAFVGHNNVITTLMKLKDTNGNYIWRDGGALQGDATKRLPDVLLGYPFYEQNDIHEDHIYFGDWSYYIIGDRQQIVVETTTVGGDAWRRNAMEIKAVERVDGRAVITSPFAKIINA